MKVRNLLKNPQQLGDRRMIGAAGTSSDIREYSLPELTARDKRRVDQGGLQVVEETLAAEPDKQKKTGGEK